MKKVFLKLLETNYDDAYLANLQKLKIDTDAIVEAFSHDDLLCREAILADKLFKTMACVDYNKYASPFYLGFGNPGSDILVVGKEKAFPASNSTLLIKESINNYRQWKEMADEEMFDSGQIGVVKKIGFSPLLPKAYHTLDTRRSHTWGITSSIITKVYPDKGLSLNETGKVEKSFFDSCFMTELNHIPAKYHQGNGLSPERKVFLRDPFFKSFPVVIFSARSYLKGDDTILKEVFNVDKGDRILLGKIGCQKVRELTAIKYRSGEQIIYVCDQLSGASGWSDMAITEFSKNILGDLQAS